MNIFLDTSILFKLYHQEKGNQMTSDDRLAKIANLEGLKTE